MTGLDHDRLESLTDRLQGSFAGAATVLMAHLGDRLGLYQNLAGQGPATSDELASRTGLTERYLREWLAQQAVVGLLTYDPADHRFALPPEHALLLTSEETPATYAGGFEALVGMYLSIDRVAGAIQTGGGVDWGEHDSRVQRGTARFFGASYRRSLIDEWVPALGVDGVLKRGALAADVGCGEGITTILLAAAYPNSRFVGIDTHGPSIESARKRSTSAGVTANTQFETGHATDLEGGPFDVIWFFDVLHDLGDPVAAATRAREQLAEDGAICIVEPAAAPDMARNITTNPAAALHYTASTFLCVPHALNHHPTAALGGQAGELALRDVLTKAGLSTFDHAATTPEHHVYVARA